MIRFAISSSISPIKGNGSARLARLSGSSNERNHFRTDRQTDGKGVELASLAAAKCEAAKVVASTICAAADATWQNSEWTVTVTDDHGAKLLHLRVTGTEVLESR
jgi:hypothetical protein